MMTIPGIVSVAVNALFPLLLLGSIGAVADRFLNFDRKTLSKLNVYVLLPPLLFSSLMSAPVDGGSVIRVAGFTGIVFGVMGVFGWLFSKWRRLDAPTASSAILGTTLFNGFNLGFPVAAFAFGEDGLLLASVLIAVNTIPHNGFGMFIAARGALSTRETICTLLRMPLLYVLGLAVILRLLESEVPTLLMGPIHSIGRAAIPYTIICLGMEMGRMRFGRIGPNLCGIVALRLLVAPLVAIVATEIVGLTGLLRSVVILQASMPCAIVPIIYARMFGGNVDVLSRAVFYSTLGSLVTIPILLAYLQS